MKEKSPKAPRVQTPDVPETGPVLVNTAAAPIIWFDGITTGGGVGIINVTLAAVLFVQRRPEEATNVLSAVAHLRCSRSAAIELRDALDKAIANGAPPPPDASVN